MPARLACGAGMIEAALVWRLHNLYQRQENGRCQPVHLGRRPPLIRHHLKGLALVGTAQDGSGEVQHRSDWFKWKEYIKFFYFLGFSLAKIRQILFSNR